MASSDASGGGGGTLPPPPPGQKPELYVGDLPKQMTQAELMELFKPFGVVINVKIPLHPVLHTPRGYAYVDFLDVNAANSAMEALNYSNHYDKAIRIMWAQRDPGARKSNNTNLFVRNLDEGMNSRDLYNAFQVFGRVLSVKLPPSPKGGNMGFGYVQFESEEDAQRAMDTMKDAEGTKGKKIVVEKYVRRTERESKKVYTNVYVRNLPKNWREAELRAAFSPFGEITSVALGPEGSGFVNYATQASAAAAIEGLNDKEVDDTSPVEAAPAAGGGGEPASEGAAPATAAGGEEAKADAVPAAAGEGSGAAAPAPASDAAAPTASAPAPAPAGDAAAALAPAAEPAAPAPATPATGEGAAFRSDGSAETPAATPAASAEGGEGGGAPAAPAPAAAPAVPRKKKLEVMQHKRKADLLRERAAKMRDKNSNNLYVKHLPTDGTFSDAQLRELFQPYGAVTSATMLSDKETGQSKGVGFVCFASREDAERALREVPQDTRDGKRPLYVNWHQSKDYRQQRNSASHEGGGARGPGGGGGGPGRYGGPGGAGAPFGGGIGGYPGGPAFGGPTYGGLGGPMSGAYGAGNMAQIQLMMQNFFQQQMQQLQGGWAGGAGLARGPPGAGQGFLGGGARPPMLGGGGVGGGGGGGGFLGGGGGGPGGPGGGGVGGMGGGAFGGAGGRGGSGLGGPMGLGAPGGGAPGGGGPGAMFALGGGRQGMGDGRGGGGPMGGGPLGGGARGGAPGGGGYLGGPVGLGGGAGGGGAGGAPLGAFGLGPPGARAGGMPPAPPGALQPPYPGYANAVSGGLGARPGGAPPLGYPPQPPPLSQMQLENIKRELTFKAGDKVAARNMLGEILYPLVLRRSGQATAGKITGMLLELTTQEVLTLLEDPVSMDNKIVEAQNVLNTSGQKRGP